MKFQNILLTTSCNNRQRVKVAYTLTKLNRTCQEAIYDDLNLPLAEVTPYNISPVRAKNVSGETGLVAVHCFSLFSPSPVLLPGEYFCVNNLVNNYSSIM
jgi:hypothetical protein